MLTSDKFNLICKLKDVLILSTRQEKKYTFLFTLIKKFLEDNTSVLVVLNESDNLLVYANITSVIPNAYEAIERKQLIIITQEQASRDDYEIIKNNYKDSEKNGYTSHKLVGICIEKSLNIFNPNTCSIIKNIGYDCFCYNDILKFDIKELVNLCSCYQAIVFEGDDNLDESNDNLEMYSNKTIKELEIILESVIYSVKTKKHTWQNIKNLEKLNIFLSRASKLYDLDEFLKKFSRTISDISDCNKCLIFMKDANGEFKVKINFSRGEFTNKSFLEDLDFENYKKDFIMYQNYFVKILKLNSNMIVCLAFEMKSIFERNKGIIEICIVSAKNIINMILEKIKNDMIISQNEKLKALGEISSGIANDFNNILATISGYTSLAMNKTQNDNVLEQLDIIKRAALDGAEMLRRIEEFTKDIKLEEKHIFDLNRLIKISKNMIQTKLTERHLMGIDLNIHMDFKSKGYVRGRESEIREVIINILNNAIDAMPNGGDIWISSYNKGDNILVEIQDTGFGIPKNIIDKIFDPFFSTKGVNGNGIGLSVSYKIIKSHKGDIKAESEDGVGSKFTFSLPIFCNENVDLSVEEINEKIYDLKVLVVDDKCSVANVIGEMLKSFVKYVDISIDPVEALNKIKSESYDLIISDLAMPKLNGIELAKLAKLKNENIYFILMTGWLGYREEKDDDFIDYILEKPFGMEDIKSILDKIY